MKPWVEVVLRRSYEAQSLVEGPGRGHERGRVEADVRGASRTSAVDARGREQSADPGSSGRGCDREKPQDGASTGPRVRVISGVSQQRDGADHLSGAFCHEDRGRRKERADVGEVFPVATRDGWWELGEVVRIGFQQESRDRVRLVCAHLPDRNGHIGTLVCVETVRLEGVPTRVFLESQDHQHDLIRELQLIDIGGRFDIVDPDVSQRLARVIADILARYGEVRAVTRRQALEALERGETAVTLDVPVRDGMTDALRTWLELLEEADRLALEGELLLVPAREEVRRLRRWYVDEIVSRLQ